MMTINLYLTAALLLWLATGFFLVRKLTLTKKLMIILGVCLAVIFLGDIGIKIILLYQNYLLNQEGPYQNIVFYFLKTGISRIGSSVLASLLISLFFTGAFVTLLRWKRGHVIDGQDVFLLSLGMFTVQWPNLLIFLLLVFVLVLLIQVVLVAVKKRTVSDRLIITPAIPVAVILTLLFGNQIAVWTGLNVIRF